MLLLHSLFYLSLLSKPLVFEVQENSTPVVGQKVVLLIQGGVQIGEGVSNSLGRVRFEVDPKTHSMVAAGTLYQNAAYISEPVATGQDHPQPIPLFVFPSTTDNSTLFIEDLSIYFEVTEEGLRVHQGMDIRNSGDKTITPHPESGILSFDIPGSAFDFTYEQGFQRDEVSNRGNTVIVNSAFYPGVKHYSFSYSVDGARFRAELPQNYSIPVKNLRFLSNHEGIRYAEPEMNFLGEKFYAGGVQKIFEHPDWNQSNFNIVVSGLPLRLPWHWVLPWIVVFSLLILGNLPSQTKKKFQPKRDFEKLLEEWLYLHRLRRENLVSDQAYRDRKFRLLEELVAFYDGKTNESQSAPL